MANHNGLSELQSADLWKLIIFKFFCEILNF